MTRKPKPLLFSGPMVRATIEKRKTKTRRVMLPQPEPNGTWIPSRQDFVCLNDFYPPSATLWKGGWMGGDAGEIEGCPYGIVGESLWVRESYRFPRAVDDLKPRDVPKGALVHYAADDDLDGDSLPPWAGRLRPSIFLPRWASRLELRITDVQVETLQKITHEDAIAEGMGYLDDQNRERWSSVAPPGETHWPTPLELFQSTWDDLNRHRGFGWDSNPYVYVISFEIAA